MQMEWMRGPASARQQALSRQGEPRKTLCFWPPPAHLAKGWVGDGELHVGGEGGSGAVDAAVDAAGLLHHVGGRQLLTILAHNLQSGTMGYSSSTCETGTPGQLRQSRERGDSNEEDGTHTLPTRGNSP
jgi:hypothetical protein